MRCREVAQTTGLNPSISGPSSITLSSVFSKSNFPTVAFVSEDSPFRFSLVTPLWPSSARFLSVVGTDDLKADYVTARTLPMATRFRATLELFVGYNDGTTVNVVTVPLMQDRSSGSIRVIGNTNSTPYFKSTTEGYGSWVFVPVSNGTLFVGRNGVASPRVDVYRLAPMQMDSLARLPRTLTQSLTLCTDALDCNGRGIASGTFPNCRCQCSSRYNTTANCSIGDTCTSALDCSGNGVAFGALPNCRCACSSRYNTTANCSVADTCTNTLDCSGHGVATGTFPNCQCSCISRYNTTANCSVADTCSSALDCGGRGVASGTFPNCQCVTTSSATSTNATKVIVTVTPLPSKSSTGRFALVGAAVLAAIAAAL